jgi:hypothetical protein
VFEHRVDQHRFVAKAGHRRRSVPRARCNVAEILRSVCNRCAISGWDFSYLP